MTDIQIATTLMQDIQDTDENPIDSRYKSLKADMAHLDEDSEEYQAIAEYSFLPLPTLLFFLFSVLFYSNH
jgi:hypothetical protein